MKAPGFPRILTVNYLSKKDSRRLGSSVLVMLEKMAKKKKKREPNYCLTAKQTNSKHTTQPKTAAHEDKYFPARLNVPLYPEFSEEEANVMQTKLYIDEEKHDLHVKFRNTFNHRVQRSFVPINELLIVSP